MIKLVGFVRRRPDIDRQAFVDHWTGPHASIAKRLPSVRAYRINILPEGNESGFDGFYEMWFDTQEDLDQARRSSVMLQELPPDRPQFLSYWVSCVADERPVVEKRDGRA